MAGPEAHALGALVGRATAGVHAHKLDAEEQDDVRRSYKLDEVAHLPITTIDNV
ncbi:MAG: hypothetical protein JO217_07645 [Acidobacteriaceae bacterium]|nr:hypothetical protein [Acidobacteriaceae bacterium]